MTSNVRGCLPDSKNLLLNFKESYISRLYSIGCVFLESKTSKLQMLEPLISGKMIGSSWGCSSPSSASKSVEPGDDSACINILPYSSN